MMEFNFNCIVVIHQDWIGADLPNLSKQDGLPNGPKVTLAPRLTGWWTG